MLDARDLVQNAFASATRKCSDYRNHSRCNFMFTNKKEAAWQLGLCRIISFYRNDKIWTPRTEIKDILTI